MTISYTAKVATCGRYGCFLRLLFRWRGSIYKLVWMDLIVFLSLYYSLTLLYCFGLNKDQQSIFESIVKYCENNSLIPLSFVLGFYVSIVMTRWWAQYMAIPWPDSIAVYVSAHIQGHDERGRIFRRTVMRYVCLCLTIALGNICPLVKKRFPTWESFIDAGLLVENEKVILAKFSKLFPTISLHWMPIVWSASIAQRARREGRIRDDLALQTIVLELNKFRGYAGFPSSYTWISIPLVYTQVVTLAVYSYFACSVMAKQWIAIEDNEGYTITVVQKYIPLFTTMEFFFYMGWLKVAESLINPFGDDDDDFEINWIIDRNLLVSYLIVDEMHHDHPELVRDQFWDDVYPTTLPYNDNDKREEPPLPSTAKIGLNTYTSDTSDRFSRVAAYLSRMSRETISRIPTAVVSPFTQPQNSKLISHLKRRPQVRSTIKPHESSSSSFSSTSSSVDIQDSEDDFERLRKKRENDRLQREKNKFLKTVDVITNAVENVSPIKSLFAPQFLANSSSDSEQSLYFVDPADETRSQDNGNADPSDEPPSSQDNTHAKPIIADSRVKATKITIVAPDDFESLKAERESRRNERMKLIIEKSLKRFNTNDLIKIQLPLNKASGSSSHASISMKKSQQSISSVRDKLSRVSPSPSLKPVPTASKRQSELGMDSEVSSIYLDVPNSSNEKTDKRPEFVRKGRSLPNIRRTKSATDLLMPERQLTSTPLRQDDAKVIRLVSRPWLTTRSFFKHTASQKIRATTSKVSEDEEAKAAQSASMTAQPTRHVRADAQHQASNTTLIDKEQTKLRDNKSISTLTLQQQASVTKQRGEVERTASDASSVYFDVIDSAFEATTRNQFTTEVTTPARRRVRLTQGRNVLPVTSETSTLYTDPDEEPSEEWHDPSRLSTKKNESKSK